MLCTLMAAAIAAQPKTLNVLFLGNSHTYLNDVPQMVKALIESDGSGTRVAVRMHSAGFVEDFWGTAVMDDIKSRRWNTVIMQGAKLSSSHKYKYDHTGAVNIANLAKKYGAKVYFFPEWPRRGWDESAWIMNEYKGIGKPIGVPVIPVSYTWDVLLKEQPKLDLWEGDGNHASLPGSFFASCTIAAYLSPNGKTPSWRPPRVDAKLAATMNRIAKQMVAKHR
jgi:hypothetical protein